MTLSRWLRDYLYIPMGGNRAGTAKIYRNLFLTFLLGGLWHGAAWTFVAWGALHGLGCCCQRAWSSAGWRMPAWAGVAVTFLFVNLTWVYFRAPDLAAANRLLATMIAPQPGFTLRIVEVWPLLILSAFVVWCCPNSQRLAAGRLGSSVIAAGGLAGAAIVAAMVATNTSLPSPFIYYNF
jgi:D-alanyl-lipoteichoic acid acyltransferase DltB (MBOAT superfamily)